MSSPWHEDFALEEIINPSLDRRNGAGDKVTSTYDLVELMQFVYVRIVKGRDLPGKDDTSSCDPYVEVKLGNCKGKTRYFEKESNPEWNQVFALPKDRKASVIEVTVKDRDFVNDEFIGVVTFDVNKIPLRDPQDEPMVPQWYMLKDRRGETVKGNLMLDVWLGTQADEAFPEAWHLDRTAGDGNYGASNIGPKEYFSPKLWYLTVNVIEAMNLHLSGKNRMPEVFVKATLGHQTLRTKISQSRNINPIWNENLMFVAAEPFDEPLILNVEDRVSPMNDEVVGKCEIHLQDVEVKLDDKAINAKKFNLTKPVEEGETEIKLPSIILLKICFEGGYHVLDEAYYSSSDFRPTAEQLWKPSIGVLELGILSARSLVPMKEEDGRERTDAYCVAKYGQKWVRTRTIIDSFSPMWNEQYQWEVFDPWTIITIAVFDNCHLDEGDNSGGVRDSKIGKIRIRLSSLETDRVYRHSYPLVLLHADGIKKMGEIQLAVRFTCPSLLNMTHVYFQTLLPKMHYLHPEMVNQIDRLRHLATQMISMRLSRAETPLRAEVIKYVLDVDSQMWSLRRSKANFHRIMALLSGWVGLEKVLYKISNWESFRVTLSFHLLVIILILYPRLILPLLFLYLFVAGILNYRSSPKHPLHIDVRLSAADNALPDELDEEFDTFPTSRPSDLVRMRYDRLRSIAGRINTVAGDLAEQGERLQSLLSWRDPRATVIVVTFFLIAVIILHVIPYRVLALLLVLYVFRHPWLRSEFPSMPLNFFRRLPSRRDCML